jgi:iron complex outermembrane recepter protein
MQAYGDRGLLALRRASILMASVAGSALSLAAANPALAQGTPNAQGASSPLVIVTGTHIPTTNLRSISPVTSTSIRQIHQIGAIDVEAVIRDLPEGFPGRGESTNNNGNGNTQANLRDLGVQRTLVLVDGQRFVSSDAGGVPDLDSVPPAIIDRIDVVTGGASAVYGSDALAGVVNIVLKSNFTGAQVDLQGGSFTEGDGQKYDASLLVGTNFDGDKGNAYAYVDYTRRTPVLSADRSWANPQLQSNGVTLEPFSSGTIPAGRVPALGLMFNDSGDLVPYDGSKFNNYRAQYVFTPQTRESVGLIAHYQATPWADIYGRLMFSRNDVDRQTHEGTGISDTVAVDFGNPFLSPQEQAILFSPGPHLPTDTTNFNFSKVFLAVGNEGEQDRYDATEAVIGVRGPIGSHFTYDVSAQYGWTDWRQVLTGDISPERLQQGLLVNPSGTCIDPSNGCVPINIFTAAAGAVTAAQANFIRLTQPADSLTTEWVTSALITGDLGALGVKSPLASNPVAVSIGADYRYESSSYRPDATLAVGDNSVYGNIPPLSGHYDVAELYVESRVPLVEDMPGAKLIAVEGGYRYSDYNLAGPVSTWKAGGIWQPNDDIRVRAAYEVAVRAPNIGELFTPPQKESAEGIDPCFSNNGAAPTASPALCHATGVPTAAYGDPLLQCPSETCEIFAGGNVALRPETADSITFGVAATPHFLPGFSASVDYYDIKITNAVGLLSSSAQVVLDNCYGSGPGQNPSQSAGNIYCQAIRRSPAGDIFTGGFNGSVGDISLLNQNVSLLSVSGVDIAVNYQVPLANLGISAIPGTVGIQSTIAYVNSYKTQSNALLPSFECAGTFGQTCGQPIPYWRAATRFTWSPNDDVSLSLRWRYIEGVTLDADRFAGMVTEPPNHAIPSFSYLDFSGSWRVTPRLVLRASVLNIFGTNPPEISRDIATASIFGFSNTFPGTYDIGTQFSIGLTAKY